MFHMAAILLEAQFGSVTGRLHRGTTCSRWNPSDRLFHRFLELLDSFGLTFVHLGLKISPKKEIWRCQVW